MEGENKIESTVNDLDTALSVYYIVTTLEE